MTDRIALVISSAGRVETLQTGDDLSVRSQKIVNLATPTLGTDGVNKNYVDTAVSAGITTGKAVAIARAQAMP